jgi:putative ABC transport system substrate-binding protein
MIGRRSILGIVPLLTIGRDVLAQGNRIYRVAILSASLPRYSSLYEGFEQRLRELGYVEGANLTIDHRNAGSRPETLPAIARELVRLEPDVIVARGPEATLRAVRDATTTVPVVFVAADYDPLALGYIRSLSHPGGNLTGVSMRRSELTGKRLELLKELVPNLATVAVLHDSFSDSQLSAAQKSADPLSLRIIPAEMRDPYDFRELLAEARRQNAEAVLAGLSPVVFSERSAITLAALEQRLPTMFGLRDMVTAGGLAAYGPDFVAHYRRAADYVDKLLTGALASDLAVEESASFQLVVNTKTARSLGMEIPGGLLARADEVIE